MIRIVIIEDQAIILEGIKVLINQVKDFTVVDEFENGQIFIDNMNNIEYDLVLTDIDMPVLNGIETTKRALNVNPEIKIIALSMYSESKYYYEMIRAGARGFVLKQASVNELEKAIRDVYVAKNYFSKDLLHNVIVEMQALESKESELLGIQSEINEREITLLKYICKGYTNKELADQLFVSVKTIESNKTKLLHKTNTKNTAGLIIWAIKNKIIEI